MGKFLSLLDKNDFLFWGIVLVILIAVLFWIISEIKKNFKTGSMTDAEYYGRHDNDGTLEIAAFCFFGAIVCIVIAAIYNLLQFLFNLFKF